MVLLPGTTEAFTLVFFSNEIKTFVSSVKYSLNHLRPFQLSFKANVKNVTLKLSNTFFKFQFKNEKIHDKAEFTQIQKLKLSNLGNAPAHFSWDEPNKKNYTISPMSGTVDPGKVFDVDIGFTSLEGIFKTDIDDVLKCNLENGSTFPINVSGALTPSKCTIVGSELLNFENIHVGVEESKEFQIKNEGKHITAYSIVL